MNNLSKYFLFLLIVGLLFFVVGMDDAAAQCAMCKGVGESNLEGGGEAAKGLNNGIIYLFLTPYVIVMVLGSYWWWRNRSIEREQLLEEV